MEKLLSRFAKAMRKANTHKKGGEMTSPKEQIQLLVS